VSKEPQNLAVFTRLAEKTIAEFRRIDPGVPARMRRRPTQAVADLIEELRVKHRIGREAPEDAVRLAWAEVVGSANASYSHPLRIEGSRLIVQATHSVVRNELFLHRREIVERIRKLPGCDVVSHLQLKAG
jgi:hypothetical protein